MIVGLSECVDTKQSELTFEDFGLLRHMILRGSSFYFGDLLRQSQATMLA